MNLPSDMILEADQSDENLPALVKRMPSLVLGVVTPHVEKLLRAYDVVISDRLNLLQNKIDELICMNVSKVMMKEAMPVHVDELSMNFPNVVDTFSAELLASHA